MLELDPLAPAFLALAASEIILGSYVLARAPLSPINRMFFWLTLLAGVGSLFDLLVASLSSAESAAWAFRTLVFLLMIEIGVAYRLLLMVPHSAPMIIMGHYLKGYWAAVLSLSLMAALTVGDMVRDASGWVPDNGVPFTILVFLLTLYLVFLTVSTIRKWGTLSVMQRKQIALFSTALAIPAAIMVIMMALALSGGQTPRIYGIGEIVSVLMLAYGILRYQMFIPPRVVEQVPVRRSAVSLAKGRGYLFESPSPDGMFESMVQEMQGGMSALIICRVHPDQLKAGYQIAQTPIVWLARTPGPDRVDPANVQLLTHLTTEFLRKGPSIIALEGLEHILLSNDLNRVVKFLGQLRDEVMINGSLLLVSVDPRALTVRQRAILERELEVVKE